MNFIVASNFDPKVGFFGQPIFVNQSQSDFIESTIRSLKICTDKSVLTAVVGKELVILGSFDDTTGAFTLLEKPQTVLKYGDYIKTVDVDLKEGA